MQSAAERAHGVQYTESIKTGWVPPSHIRNMTEAECVVSQINTFPSSFHLAICRRLMYLCPPLFLCSSVCDTQAFRKKWHIICEGVDLPPPIKDFKNMRFPEPIMKALQKKGIMKPTPIQVGRYLAMSCYVCT